MAALENSFNDIAKAFHNTEENSKVSQTFVLLQVLICQEELWLLNGVL